MDKGFPIYDSQALIAWWEFTVQDSILSAVPFVPSDILDVGANYGALGCAAKLRWKNVNVHAIEPNRKWATMVQLHSAYKTVFNFAASDSNRVGLLYQVADEGATATFHKTLYKTHSKPIEVECRTIDSLPFGGWDLIKIDVDGHEREVLRGGITAIREARAVIVELTDEEAVNEYRAALPEPEWKMKRLTVGDYIFIKQ